MRCGTDGGNSAFGSDGGAVPTLRVLRPPQAAIFKPKQKLLERKTTAVQSLELGRPIDSCRGGRGGEDRRDRPGDAVVLH